MQKKINFNAGPAEMPAEVLYEAAKAVRKYDNAGLSILEMPHRGKDFMDIVEEANALVKELCRLKNDYEVVWLQGGGRMQFCMTPMNLLTPRDAAGYIISGHWAEDAFESATHYGDAQVLASSKDTNYNRLPEWPSEIPKQLTYVHITTNNTIYGTQWHNIPKTNIPLIADMSSDIFSGKRNYTDYSMFYAAVQKNLGTPGVALCVIRKDLLEKMNDTLPPMLSYKAHVKANSVLNTPNVFGIYVSLLMLRWIKQQGIDTIEKENKRKAKLLYDTLDAGKLFRPYVKEKADRSLMNVCFTAATPDIEKKFLSLCEDNDITGIKGHRSTGGFRVSLYNAIPYSSVERLVELMTEFERK
jgi:phosphoserine aminotransferase